MAIFNSYVKLPEGTNSIEQEGIAKKCALGNLAIPKDVFWVYFTASID
jgi:hypothetical protein